MGPTTSRNGPKPTGPISRRQVPRRARPRRERLEDRTVPSAGMLDPTFGPPPIGIGGRVITTHFYPQASFGDFVEGSNSLVVQADGKIVVAGGAYQQNRSHFAV